LEIVQRLKEFGLGCPKCAESVVRRLNLCTTCLALADCPWHDDVRTLAEKDGISILVVRCERFSE